MGITSIKNWGRAFHYIFFYQKRMPLQSLMRAMASLLFNY